MTLVVSNPTQSGLIEEKVIHNFAKYLHIADVFVYKDFRNKK